MTNLRKGIILVVLIVGVVIWFQWENKNGGNVTIFNSTSEQSSTALLTPAGAVVTTPFQVTFSIPKNGLSTPTSFTINIYPHNVIQSLPTNVKVYGDIEIIPTIDSTNSPLTNLYSSTITLPLFEPAEATHPLEVLRYEKSSNSFVATGDMAEVPELCIGKWCGIDYEAVAKFQTNKTGLFILVSQNP